MKGGDDSTWRKGVRSAAGDSPAGEELTKRTERMHRAPLLHQDPVGTCDYCGAPLSGHLFFCQTCGKAYREAPGSRGMPPPKTTGELIEEKAPNFWPVFWAVAISLFVGYVLSALLFGSEDFFEAYYMVVASLVLILTTAVLTLRYYAFLAKSLSRIGFGRWEAWAGLLLLFPLLGVNWLWHFEFLRLLEPSEEFLDYGAIGLTPLACFFLICLLPAITEEIAFRGLLQPMLAVPRGEMTSLLLISALFGAIHLSLFSFPYLFLLGLLLGWTRLRTGSLYPPMLLHFVHNFIVVFVFSY